MYHKDAVLHPRKLDWMLLHRRNDLRKVMRDNGSFVAFPKMGSGGNLVTVYAESRVNAERTLRSLHFLVSAHMPILGRKTCSTLYILLILGLRYL